MVGGYGRTNIGQFTPMVFPSGKTLLRQGSFSALYKTMGGVDVNFLTSMDGKIMHSINHSVFNDARDSLGRMSTGAKYRIIEICGDGGMDSIVARWEPIPGKNRSIGYVAYKSPDGRMENPRFLADDTMRNSFTAAIKSFKLGWDLSPLNDDLDVVVSMDALGLSTRVD